MRTPVHRVLGGAAAAIVIVAAVAAVAPSQAEAAGPVVEVETVADLRAAVAAGQSVRLKKGTYLLHEADGPLVLQPGTSLEGEGRDLVRIRSRMLAPLIVAWSGNRIAGVSIRADGGFGAVGISVDVSALPAGAEMAGASVAIEDCRIASTDTAVQTVAEAVGGRDPSGLASSLTIHGCDLVGLDFGVALAVYQLPGIADHAWTVSSSENEMDGWGVGVFTLTLGCTGTRTAIQSSMNVYRNGGRGAFLRAGLSDFFSGAPTADNSLRYDSEWDRYEGMEGPAAIEVRGAQRTGPLGAITDCHADVRVIGSVFEGNATDIRATGARSLAETGWAGAETRDNTVKLLVRDCRISSVIADDLLPAPQPGDPVSGNRAIVVDLDR